jgi:hypothetical protein
VIELANTPEARREGYFVDRQCGVTKQMASGTQAARVGDLNRRRTQMFCEQTAQMPRADTNMLCQFIYTAMIHRPRLDQAQRTRHHR